MEIEQLIQTMQEKYDADVKPHISTIPMAARLEMANLVRGFIEPNRDQITRYHWGPLCISYASALSQVLEEGGNPDAAKEYFETSLGQFTMAVRANNRF